MGGSLLTAIGVPELIAYDLGDYERKAVALAKSQQELDRLREKLSRARHGSQAFNMKSLARQIEAMFLTIAKPIVGDLDKTVSVT
jgi:predicted O-linked N-acetylglucosamine transferase (SPINDLY family)